LIAGWSDGASDEKGRETESGETDDDAGEHFAGEQIEEGPNKDEEREYEYDRQTSNDEVDAPGCHCILPTLLIPTIIDSGSKPRRTSVTVEHLLAHHDEGYGEGERGQTQAKAGSDKDYGEIGAIPHRAVGVSSGLELQMPDIGDNRVNGVVRFFEIALEVVPDEDDGSVRDHGE
jgi:hypothetical protein